MELQVGVKILLNNEEGKYLLLRRSKKKYPEVMDIWDIPGGRIDPGVSLLENLKREMREEIELELKAEPKLIAAQDIMRITGRHVVRLTYLGTIEGRPTLDAEENDEYKWFSRGELEEIQGLDRYLKELLETKVL